MSGTNNFPTIYSDTIAFDPTTDGKVSTCYAPDFSILNFLPVMEIEYDNGSGTQVTLIIDLLSYSFVDLLSSVTNWTPLQYDGVTPLTTIVYNAYGNTTLLWFFCMYNGIIHPLEVAPGMLRVPDYTQLVSYLVSKASPSNVGNTVTI